MTDFSKKYNKDWATFLPAMSTFYLNMMYKTLDIDPARIPQGFENGMDGLNFLDPNKGYFHYDNCLYSAGHAYLDIDKSLDREALIHQRDKSVTVVGDSGGFQIGKGVIKFDWERFFEKKGDKGYKGTADKTRMDILNWLELTSDWAMTLDVPTWACNDLNRERTKLRNFDDCLDATLHNLDFFEEHRLGKTKFLNVLQGNNWEEAEVWYNAVKDRPFEGWGMGALNMRDMYVVLKRLIIMRDEGKLEGKDWMHFLGTSKLDWACYLTAIQKQLRKHANPNITVSFDCASPFIACANALTYTAPVHTPDRWSYIMESFPDYKHFKGSSATVPFDSPIYDRLTMGDICVRGFGELNAQGKETKTSWDTWSYLFVMAHNVYQHIKSVEQANAYADIECKVHQPSVVDWKKLKKSDKSDRLSPWVPRNVMYFNTFVEEVFSSTKPMSLIEDNKAFLKDISNNASAFSSNNQFDMLFEQDKAVHDDTEFGEDEIAKLDDLENGTKE